MFLGSQDPAKLESTTPQSEFSQIQDDFMKQKVLFICVHNSARSQMAAAWLNDICGDYFEAQSAGLEPGQLNPLVIQAMDEAGIDISNNKTQAVFDVFKSGQFFPYVITVCDESEAAGCPTFPGVTYRLHWSFPDPSELSQNGLKARARFAMTFGHV